MRQGGKLGKLDGMGDSGAQKIKYQERIWRMGRNPVWFGYFVYFTFLHRVIIAFCGDTVISLNFDTQFDEIVAQKYSPFHYMCFIVFFYSCMFFWGQMFYIPKHLMCIIYVMFKETSLRPRTLLKVEVLPADAWINVFFWGRMGIGFE